MPDRVLGTLVMRRNRFAAEVLVDGCEALAHVPNSGRMLELMVPGADIVLNPIAVLGRKTAYDLTAVRYAGRWVGVDARIPPAAVVEAWRKGLLPGFDAYDEVRREVVVGASRIDLRFDGSNGPIATAFVEAKSVNLVEGGVALFPDAPTTRGARHVLELREVVRQGHRGVVCFVVQRDDVRVLRPFREADPRFADALALAVADGVEAYAISCVTDIDGTVPVGLVPVELT